MFLSLTSFEINSLDVCLYNHKDTTSAIIIKWLTYQRLIADCPKWNVQCFTRGLPFLLEAHLRTICSNLTMDKGNDPRLAQSTNWLSFAFLWGSVWAIVHRWLWWAFSVLVCSLFEIWFHIGYSIKLFLGVMFTMI